MSLIFTLKIKNYKNEIYELTHDYEHYYVMSVSGLTPPVTTINTTVSGIHDGSYYNSSRVQQRNIVITVGLRGNKQFPVNLESSDTVTALTEMLPLTLDMSDTAIAVLWCFTRALILHTAIQRSGIFQILRGLLIRKICSVMKRSRISQRLTAEPQHR